MAQTGFTPIQLYSSSTATNVPLAANLATGELAINITDGKLFYKDNAAAVQVIGWKTVPATAGGTGQTSYAVGDLLYANTTTTLAKLADVATGNALISGGVGVAPSYGKIGLTTHVSGTLGTANGGTNVSSSGASGSILVSNGSNFTTNVVPAFLAQLTAAQTIAGASFVKITLNNEIFDTNSNFDPTTNYRFTPTVAGYYQINAALFYNTTGASGLMQMFIYKNGSTEASTANILSALGYVSLSLSQVIYCNGSTDYLELYTYNGNAAAQTTSNATYVYMSGSLIRGA
jgi:hypothetical protein